MRQIDRANQVAPALLPKEPNGANQLGSPSASERRGDHDVILIPGPPPPKAEATRICRSPQATAVARPLPYIGASPAHSLRKAPAKYSVGRS
jgi:hypothetical protein